MEKFFHKIILIFCLFLMSPRALAQLGFCQGNSGDPIFEETFGTGLVDTSLPPGTTTYNYANGADPDDGLYTVTSNTNYFDWFDIDDHTPGDVDGRMLLVNSDFAAGEFYRTEITGLCENTTYEFSSWIVNLTPLGGFCGAGVIPVNVRFEIWDSTDTNLLASGDTGNINSTVAPLWQQYALVFQTIPTQTSVILKMINNGTGGCGNDLAIDDIIFKSCGDTIDVTDSTNSDSISICSSEVPFSTTITAVPDNTVFSNHFYQWQESSDNVIWTDLPGETNEDLVISGVNDTMHYRAKVAEFAANLSNDDCITFSDVYSITVFQAPPPPTLECWETATLDPVLCDWIVTGTQPAEPTGLECWETTSFNNTTCSWDILGTQPAEPTGLECWQTTSFNNATCSWDILGTQPAEPTGLECWEVATFNNTTCVWEVTGTQPAEPTGLECWETSVFNDTTCTWEISGTQPPPPNVECWETATFNNATCSWDVTGTQPPEPTGLECWEVTTFNNSTCSWEISGTQPSPPTLECWQTAVFDNMTCTWEVSGTQPEEPTGLECWEVTTFNNATCSWEVSGEQPDPPTNLECWESTSFDVSSCSWIITGTQPTEPFTECWETTIFNDITCSWEITGTQPEAPTDLECWQTAVFNNDTCSWELLGEQTVVFIDEEVEFCEGESITLEANGIIANPTYSWNTGSTAAAITIFEAGVYTVEITDGCSLVNQTFVVTELETPVIASVFSDGNNIIVETANTGNFVYSLDGSNYQSSPVFFDQLSGKYTIFVRNEACDEVVNIEHIHFYIPKFFTPNGDTYNNTFFIGGLECFQSSEVKIFDRYGKLLYAVKNNAVSWDGTFKGNALPSSDYWYIITIDGQEFKGHFALKR